MLGEELNSSYVTDRGLLGDRVYALIDHQTGKVASAKNPGKWGRLFDFRAVLGEVVDFLPLTALAAFDELFSAIQPDWEGSHYIISGAFRTS